MFDTKKLSIQITITAENELIPEPTDNQLRCELWIGCNSAYCHKNGCLNTTTDKNSSVLTQSPTPQTIH